MTQSEFLNELDEILGLPAGTVRADQKLDELENWDSMALISFIVLAETHSNVSILPDQIVTCSTVADLLGLAQIRANGAELRK
jgi:acyl carrier protein